MTQLGPSERRKQPDSRGQSEGMPTLACRVRSGSAPQIFAELRNTALTMIRQTGQQPRPAREAFAERKWSAIKLVMGS